ncbi:MAG: PD40 domain-containing protein [Candidatus Omnitrophica bacterium]|nr:PD40 domain-containing protein [Candidatus Omnitrophota bacterium]
MKKMLSVVVFSFLLSGCAAVDKAYFRKIAIDPTRDISETLISAVDLYSWVQKMAWVSPDSKHICYVVQEGKQQYVVLNGKEGKRYDFVGQTLVFSPDSQRLAYLASQGGKQFVVVDGREGKRYEFIGEKTLVFSPSSQRFAYGAKEDGQWFAVIDTEEQNKYDGLGPQMVFSANNKDFAYVVMEYDYAAGKEEWFVVLNGVEERRYDGISTDTPRFSPDGKRMAYGAQKEEQWFMVIDGVEGKRYHAIGVPVFSPDNRRIAYKAAVMGERPADSWYRLMPEWFLVLDGKDHRKHDNIVPGTIVFSPDSRRYAYGAQKDFQRFKISEGGKRDAAGTIDLNCFTIEGDEVIRKFIVQSGYMVIDGLIQKSYDGIGSNTVVFSPDNINIAYASGEWTIWDLTYKWGIVVNSGEPTKRYDRIDCTPVFSSDSQHLAYVSGRLVIVDEKYGRMYDRILSNVVFDSPEAFHYLALKGADIYLIEEKI